MTQPAPPPEQDHTAAIVAAAVTSLALIALEQRVRQQVEDDIQTALIALTAYLFAVLATPAALISTGSELFSRPDVHKRLVDTITRTRDAVTTTVEAGYTAATRIAHTQTTTALTQYDYRVPTTLPELDPSIDQISRDINTMFGHAQTDIQNTVTNTYTGEQTPLGDAMNKAAARLQQRATAAATTAVHQGASDTEQAIYREFANTTGLNLAKRWRTTSNDPCGMCQALNNTIAALGAEFDHHATTNNKDLRPIWRNLLGPPRHPNCRCRLELLILG